jgi:hypothetical protein
MSCAPVSVEDALLVAHMREVGVLNRVNGYAFDPKGTVLITCSDGNRIHTVLNTKRDIYLETGVPDPCVHTLALNGGPVNLAPELYAGFSSDEYPLLVVPHADRVLLSNIAGAMLLKRLNSINLCGHLPCGVVTGLGLNASDALRLLVQAKFRVKAAFQGVGVTMFVHVATRDSPEGTIFFVNRDKAVDWLATSAVDDAHQTRVTDQAGDVRTIAEALLAS